MSSTQISPREALARLREGNERFVSEKRLEIDLSAREALVKGQHPYAVILSCADSRVVPEFIFSAGLGELFVIRVAGNVCSETELGSAIYAAEHLGVRLFVVLGHENCGAVHAALNDSPCGAVAAITGKILAAAGVSREETAVCARNVLASRAELEKALAGVPGCEVLGAVYHLASGAVMFLDHTGAGRL